jgi:hypothetical protein
MKPAFVVLNMYQGQTYTDTLTLTDAAGAPLDLTGRSARMQVRDDFGATKLSLGTADGTIVGPLGTSGVIAFHIPAVTLAAMSTQYDYEQWNYDLELFYTSGSEEIVERPVRGVVLFWPEITV